MAITTVTSGHTARFDCVTEASARWAVSGCPGWAGPLCRHSDSRTEAVLYGRGEAVAHRNLAVRERKRPTVGNTVRGGGG